MERRLYPIAVGEPLPIGMTAGTTRAVATDEFRSPREGEWYLSGGRAEALRAVTDMRRAYRIAVLARAEVVYRLVEGPGAATVGEVQAAVTAADSAADGISDDEEITALRAALTAALSRWPEVQRRV